MSKVAQNVMVGSGGFLETPCRASGDAQSGSERCTFWRRQKRRTAERGRRPVGTAQCFVRSVGQRRWNSFNDSRLQQPLSADGPSDRAFVLWQVSLDWPAIDPTIQETVERSRRPSARPVPPRSLAASVETQPPENSVVAAVISRTEAASRLGVELSLSLMRSKWPASLGWLVDAGLRRR